MKSLSLIDPQLLPALELLTGLPINATTLPQHRALVAQQVDLLRTTGPSYPDIEVTEHRVPGPPGAPSVRVLAYRPVKRSRAPSRHAGLLWIHGGGYVAGTADWDDLYCKRLATEVGCCIVNVDYRLAPETPFPGPVEDCYAALKWMHAKAADWQLDPARIGIAGLSAGGGLCAALGLLARDRAEVPVCFQAPLQAMLDDRTCTATPHPWAGELVWTAESNRFGWSSLLGHEPGHAGVSPHASAARAVDLRGLPPTYLAIGSIDLFIDENLQYAQRLLQAGVIAEFKVYAGGFHAFQMLAPSADVSKDYERDVVRALRRGLKVDAEAVNAEGAGGDSSVEGSTAAVAAVMEQLKQMMPGLLPEDAQRFAASLATPEPYAPSIEAQAQDGVPRGTLTQRQCAPRSVYPGVPHDYTVYVPHGLDPSRPAGLIVFQDGARYLGPEIHAATVLDNLIHQGDLPPIVAVFVQPGPNGPGLPIYGGVGNRSVEYDSLGDNYVRFLLDELLPEALAGLNISQRAEDRAICGLSSGGICAFNAAWERPDAFGKVISHCGSYVNIRGGHALASQVRRQAIKPLRVFLQTGMNDLNIVFGHWVQANRDLAEALAYRGYDHQLVVGDGGHSLAHGGAIFPQTLRWLWRDHRG